MISVYLLLDFFRKIVFTVLFYNVCLESFFVNVIAQCLDYEISRF